MRAKPLFCVFFCLLVIDPVTSQRVLGALLGGALGHQVRKQTNGQTKMKQSNKQMKYFLAINYNNTYIWSLIDQIKHIWTKHIWRFNLYFKQTNTNSKKKKAKQKNSMTPNYLQQKNMSFITSNLWSISSFLPERFINQMVIHCT